MLAFYRHVALCLVFGVSLQQLKAADWPMFGRDASRNAVSPESDPPTEWQIKGVILKQDKDGKVLERVEESKNVKWMVPLGTMCLSSPVVANGLVWVGTNNIEWMNQKVDYDKQGAILRCYRESDGELLYESFSRSLQAKRYQDSSFWQGLSCSPLAEGNRLYYVSNLAEIICLDISPLTRHHKKVNELKQAWKIDMPKELGVYPRVMFMGPGRLCSIGASDGNRIYITTGNGSDYVRRTIPAPDAPSLICVDKRNGKVLWKDNSPGKNLLQGSFGSPLVAEIDGRKQVIAPQGDGWIRGFDAVTGKMIWEFDINPKTAKYDNGFGRGNSRNWFMSTPVFYKNRIYIASGQGAEQGDGQGRLVCIDPTKEGDISSQLAVDAKNKPLPKRRELAVDEKKGEKAVPNPNSGLVWEFKKVGEEFEDTMHRTVCTVAIHNDIVVAPDIGGAIHFLDANTGKRFWSHDTFASFWASPLIVDGKVFIGDEDRWVNIYELSKEKHKPKQIDVGNDVYATSVFANGVLYLPRRDMLIAIEKEGAK